MWNNLSINELFDTIKEVVDMGKEVTFTPNGKSMLPTLRGGKDEVVVAKPKFPLKKYDMPIYLHESGGAVLHRVIAACTKNGNTTYVLRGDNTYQNEIGITEEQIIAVVTRFKKGDKWYTTDSNGFKIYSAFWCGIYPLRKALRFLFRLPIRVIRKIKNILK